jgi:hypothetical protein
MKNPLLLDIDELGELTNNAPGDLHLETLLVPVELHPGTDLAKNAYKIEKFPDLRRLTYRKVDLPLPLYQ